ncbi:MAG: 16S rRNA (adenine(1518)-N(6)/adenine(1519)-N(6))-dimethyltransferase RsmA [Desulfobacteraceae bacterium]|jgi:16S rRNA (adenine1518-N6/adenine1519-N6)-dimethyltransferase
MTTPRKLLTAWNLKAKKEFGQNFLNDTSIAKMLVSRTGLTTEDVVLEIGAGLGALTIPIAKTAGKVFAVEKDRNLITLLKTELLVAGISNVTLIEQDILNLDLRIPTTKTGQKLTVMGNLPYNISSQVLIRLIKERGHITRAILMFQKELADRLSAPAGIKAYGRLSVMLGYCAEVKAIATIPARMFFPRPKVDSTVVDIQFKQKPTYPAKSEALLHKVIKTAFGKRRKTLKNALVGNELQLDTFGAQHYLKQAGIDPVRRAETLSVAEFVCLSNCLYNRDESL